MNPNEEHKSHRIGWLRAAVLGANDGIVSTASLIIGVAAAHSTHENIVLVGVAGLVAGAMSMAAGEYVSVSSQADTEKAELALEQYHLDQNPEFEMAELVTIYEGRGLDTALAQQVAYQLMAFDALGAHARDELGIIDMGRAQPVQAALSSALAFVFGAALPLFVAIITPLPQLIALTAVFSLIFLAGLGVVAAHLGGASKRAGAMRVTFWGALAMLATALIGNVMGIGL